MQDVDEPRIVVSSTKPSISVQTLIFNSRFSGTHSWMYIASWTQSLRLEVPVISFPCSTAGRVPRSVPASSNSRSSDLMFSRAVDTWLGSTSNSFTCREHFLYRNYKCKHYSKAYFLKNEPTTG